MTTAQLRECARAAADRIAWSEAAELMAEAIAKYPGNPASPLVQLDLANMQRLLAGYRAAARQEAA